jgi:hypothetical protein
MDKTHIGIEKKTRDISRQADILKQFVPSNIDDGAILTLDKIRAIVNMPKDKHTILNMLNAHLNNINDNINYFIGLKNYINNAILEINTVIKDDNTILELEVNEFYVLKNVEYDNIFINEKKYIHIKLASIDQSFITYIDENKRSIKLTVINTHNVIIFYNILFDIQCKNNDTYIIKCTYYVSR